MYGEAVSSPWASLIKPIGNPMRNARGRRRTVSSPYNGAEPFSTQKHQPSEKSGAERRTPLVANRRFYD
jgi:hypothetical protein